MIRERSFLFAAAVFFLFVQASCVSTSQERNTQASGGAETDWEGVWEGEEITSEFQLGGQSVTVPAKQVIEVQTASDGGIQGQMTVHLYLSEVEQLPPGISDASQTFQIRGTYDDTQLELSVLNDDGSVNAEYQGRMSDDGTLRLTSSSGTSLLFTKRSE